MDKERPSPRTLRVSDISLFFDNTLFLLSVITETVFFCLFVIKTIQSISSCRVSITYRNFNKICSTTSGSEIVSKSNLEHFSWVN